MLASASEIIDRLFTRAGEDAVAAPLADAFAGAYRDGRWNSEVLDSHVRSLIEERLRSTAAHAAPRAGG